MNRTLPSRHFRLSIAVLAVVLVGLSFPAGAGNDAPWMITIERVAIRPPAGSGWHIIRIGVTLDAGDPATYSRLLLEREDLRERFQRLLPRHLDKLPGWSAGDPVPIDRLQAFINAALTQLAGCPAHLSDLLVR